MISTTPTIGASLQARCTKCRKMTKHTIVTIGADHHPAEVQCSKCRQTSIAKKPVDRRAMNSLKAQREEWAVLQQEMNTAPAQATDYSMTASYKVKALLNHSVFGLGQVQRISGSQKMVVLFADGEKVMRCK